MEISSIGLEWLIIGVFTICFFFILITKGDDRFWLPTIIIWLFLFFALILGNAFSSNEVSYQEMLQKETVIKNEQEKTSQTFELERANKDRANTNNKMIHLLGTHTLFSFVWMLLGYRQTSLKYYKTAAISFAAILILYLFYIILGG